MITLSTSREWRLHLYSIVVVLAFLSSAPLVVGQYYTRLLAVGVLFGLAAMGFNILFGYTGLLSFGHAMFWGLGAYGVAIGLVKLGLGFLYSYFLSLILVLVVAVVTGYLSLRHTKIYFAILTLAFSQLVYAIVLKYRDLTGGDEGLYGIPRPLGSIISYYYLVVGVSGALLVLLWMLLRSPLGLAFQVIRDDPFRAEALGYNVSRLRLLSFIISGIVTGIAGSLYSPLQGAITPESLYWTFSAEIVFMAILGGTRVFLGPFIGGIVYVFLRDYAMDLTEYWLFAMGLALAVLIYALPQGVLGAVLERYLKAIRLGELGHGEA
ncbi:MAG: branched-chain amino acid ABC transporter permease [Pyrodictiaceae archaeon]